MPSYSSISGAFGSVPGAVNVGSTAAGSTDQQIAAQKRAYEGLPGYNSDIANIGKTIGSETAGVLPDDVKQQIQQAAAERGVVTGNVEGPGADAAYLRALGLTSLNLTNQGQSDLKGILPTLPGAPVSANPNFYVTPQQQYEASLQNSIFRAMPDPAAAAQTKLAAAQSGFASAGGWGGGGSGGLPAPPVIPAAQDFGPYGPGSGGGGGSTMIRGSDYNNPQSSAGGGTSNGLTPSDLTLTSRGGDSGQNQDSIQAILDAYAPTVTGEQPSDGSSGGRIYAGDYNPDPFNVWGDGGGD